MLLLTGVDDREIGQRGIILGRIQCIDSYGTRIYEIM